MTHTHYTAEQPSASLSERDSFRADDWMCDQLYVSCISEPFGHVRHLARDLEVFVLSLVLFVDEPRFVSISHPVFPTLLNSAVCCRMLSTFGEKAS